MPLPRSLWVRRFFVTGRSLIFATAALLSAGVRAAVLPQGNNERATFTHSIAAVAATATDPNGRPNHAVITRSTLTTAETAASMRFEVALAMRNFDELEARLAHSEIIPPDEMQARYFPLAADHDRVVRWLESEGLAVTRTDANHLAVFARGSVAEVARVFQTTFARVAADGAEFTSAIAAPSLPARLAPAVRGIHGLQPHVRLHRRPHSQLLPLAGTGNSIPYYPAQISKAYNAANLNVTGSGQTIAIYALAFPRTSDLVSFWQTTGVPASAANIQNVNVAGGPLASPTAGYVEEATLDVEWASALAPGAVIRIYAASENDPVGDDELIQEILADLPAQPSLHQLTISFGADESTSDRDYIAIEAQYMASLVGAGVTVFAASGDSGALGNNGSVQTGYPASMPDVTAVGGTSLLLNPDGTVATENAWGTRTNSGSSGASGGGISTVFNRPSWQAGTGVPAGTMRLVPDVAAVADPSTGAFVFYNGRAAQIGGTSLSSPIWAAWCALLNESRARLNQPPLGALNPRLYPLAGTAAFRDITTGGNSVYAAGAGYDLTTGIGVPDVTALLQATTADSFAPVIEVQSGNRFTTTGQSAMFYVVATSNPAPSYRWQRLATGTSTWTDLTDNSTYAGAITYVLNVSSATFAMNGDQFRCVLSNGGVSVIGAPATLSVGASGVSTVAGWPGWSGFADGQGSAGRFNYTGSVRLDSAGTIYVADASNNTVRKITPAGVVSTLAGAPGVAGSTDGAGSIARFNGPAGVAVDATGNVYVADSQNYTIRKITPAGVVSTVAGNASVQGNTDGTGSAASFYDPENLAIGPDGNIYVAEGRGRTGTGGGNSVRKVTPAGVVTTLAGSPPTAGTADGTGSAARFNLLAGITVDLAGNVYVGDFNNNSVRKITPAGVVTTLAGLSGARNFGFIDGTGSAARFSGPTGLAVDAAGNVFVADSFNNAIRKISPAGVVTTLAGSATVAENIDGTLDVARFSGPADVALDAFGNLFVADALNCTIRRIALATGTPPVVATQPVALTVNSGQNANFTITAQGTTPLVYQWQMLASGSTTWLNLADGAPFSGAATATLGVSSAAVSLDGSQFRCLVQNGAGVAVSSAATLFVLGPPFVTTSTGAQTQNVVAGGSVTLSASATGRALTYQWKFNGTNLASANGATLTLSNFQAANAGAYSVAISNSFGSVTANIGTLNLVSAYLSNLSVRANLASSADVLIVGFVIGGNGSAQMLVRGIGPALAPFGVTGVLARPLLTLSAANGTTIATNSGWANSATLAALFRQVGAFALPTDSADAAMVQSLAASGYTAQISGVGGTAGAALAELYDSDTGAITARPINISARANVGTGGNILIAGFSISGVGSERLLIRAAGPTLSLFGVTGALANPVLTVFDSSQKPLATNSGWSGDPTLASAAAQNGEFPFLAGSADAALLLTVPAGGYTVQVSGANATTGVALIEIYEMK